MFKVKISIDKPEKVNLNVEIKGDLQEFEALTEKIIVDGEPAISFVQELKQAIEKAKKALA